MSTITKTKTRKPFTGTAKSVGGRIKIDQDKEDFSEKLGREVNLIASQIFSNSAIADHLREALLKHKNSKVYKQAVDISTLIENFKYAVGMDPSHVYTPLINELIDKFKVFATLANTAVDTIQTLLEDQVKLQNYIAEQEKEIELLRSQLKNNTTEEDYGAINQEYIRRKRERDANITLDRETIKEKAKEILKNVKYV